MKPAATTLTLVCFFVLLPWISVVRAQSAAAPPAAVAQVRRFAVFRTASLDPALAALAPPLDPLLLEQLETVARIEIAAKPALDLPAMQLAIDCAGEMSECMRAVTLEAGVDGLVAPVLRSAGAETIVTLLYFDLAEGAMRGATRRLSGDALAQQLADAVPQLVREVFEQGTLDTAAAPVGAMQSEAVGEPTPPAPLRPELRAPVLPIVLAASGAVFLSAGLGLGIASQNAEADYAKARPDSVREVNAALDQLDKAQRQALLANLSFGLGGAALVAAATVWWLDSRKHAQAQAPKLSLVPSLGSSQVMLMLRGAITP